MMPIVLKPFFDGEWWRCSCCNARLAKIVTVSRPAFATPYGFDFTKRKNAMGLELLGGFVKNKGVWLKPAKVLPSGRGAHNAYDRKKKNAFTRGQLDRAHYTHDVASIVESTDKLTKVEEKRFAPSKLAQEAQTEVAQLFTEDLPASVQCPKANCGRIFLLTSVA